MTMTSQLIYILVVAFVIESITQIIIKSVILDSIRSYLITKVGREMFTYLLTCAYCFSFWVSVFVNLVALYSSTVYLTLIDNTFLNFIVVVLVTHRLGNIIHGCIDKYFDKRYDIRYTKIGED